MSNAKNVNIGGAKMDLELIFAANPAGVRAALKDKTVFLGGLGGLGSNVAMLLCRAGVGHLVGVDFDTVSASNLNRQFYFADQIGLDKSQALIQNLRRINPGIELSFSNTRLSDDNFMAVLTEHKIDLICECFDCAAAKAMIITQSLKRFPALPIVGVSGIGGVGEMDNLLLRHHINKNLHIVGDFCSDAARCGTLSARVMTASAMQANLAILLLLGK